MALPPTTQLPEERRPGGKETGGARSAKGAKGKRYNIILRIKHAELDPAEISAALGWEPDSFWKAGDQAVTPRGTKLPGRRSSGVWSCNFRDQGETRIADKLDEILGHLIQYKKLFHKLHGMGAEVALYLQLPGDVNNGARIPCNILKKCVELKLAFELETFPDWK